MSKPAAIMAKAAFRQRHNPSKRFFFISLL
jgi:hypothetical protein